MSNGYRFAYSSQPQRLVKEVQFGVLSPEEIVGIDRRVPWHLPRTVLLT